MGANLCFNPLAQLVAAQAVPVEALASVQKPRSRCFLKLFLMYHEALKLLSQFWGSSSFSPRRSRTAALACSMVSLSQNDPQKTHVKAQAQEISM